MTATSCPSRDDLLAYHRGELPEELAGRVIAHIASCVQCQAVLETFDDAHDTLVARLRQPAVESPYAAEPHGRELVARAKALVPAGGGTGDELPEEPCVLRELGEYQLIEKLGEGGMGAVYKARQTKLKKTVALKVLPKDRMEDQRALARFEREMEAVGAVDHPNIVRAMDAREVDGVHFLVMEYVEGIDLSKLVHRLGPLPVPDACEIIRQAALGLQYAHEHGLIHRDIKPSNLMLSSPLFCSGKGEAGGWGLGAGGRGPTPVAPMGRRVGGEGESGASPRSSAIGPQPAKPAPLAPHPSSLAPTVKILDLGLALFKRQEGPLGETTDTGQAMGTADYMAPEQFSDSHAVDIRADIYSLGCTLYKLLTGHAPFSGPEYTSNMAKMMAHVQEPVPPIADRRDDVPEALAKILDRMLAKTPDERYATPAEVAEALSSLSFGERAGVRGQPVPGSDLGALAAGALNSKIETGRPAPSRATTEEFRSSALVGTRPRHLKSPTTTAAPVRRHFKPWQIAVAMLPFACVALGIVIWINRTRIEVPEGSEVTVGRHGDATVTLPQGYRTGRPVTIQEDRNSQEAHGGQRGGVFRFADGTTRRFERLAGVGPVVGASRLTFETHPEELYFRQWEGNQEWRVPIAKLSKVTFDRSPQSDEECRIILIDQDGRKNTISLVPNYLWAIDVTWSGGITTERIRGCDLPMGLSIAFDR